MRRKSQAVIIGGGPNGLAAGIELARAGLAVLLLEKSAVVGGGAQSGALTLPGFVHDICSAVHPLALASPFFRSLPLAQYGLQWIHSPAALAHPFNDGTAYLLERSVERTAAALGRDEKAYRKIFTPLTAQADGLMEEILQPLFHWPRHLAPLLAFGRRAALSVERFAQTQLREEKTRAFFAGVAAHSTSPFREPFSAAIGLTLQIAGHAYGWPISRGGSQAIAHSLLSLFLALGGKVRNDFTVRSLADIPGSDCVLFNLSPGQVEEIAGSALAPAIREKLRAFRHGPGIFKLDWALRGPIPWRAPACGLAATVHLGGSFAEIARSERQLSGAAPFVLLSQPSLFDRSRAPAGMHTAWAYCHSPNGSVECRTEAIEDQVERFAPGFRRLILKRSAWNCHDFEAHNANLVGGDISGGLINAQQLLFRPFLKWDPYALDGSRYWICSASTPPGPGVHGMCGFHAARSILRRISGD